MFVDLAALGFVDWVWGQDGGDTVVGAAGVGHWDSHRNPRVASQTIVDGVDAVFDRGD